MSASWLIIESGPGAPEFNMAMDEALLESMPRIGRPLLRFYGWTIPAASFGYFQKYDEVEKATHLRPLVRRPTGGGIVPHDNDWTYSLVFPANHEWFALKAIESYRAAHHWITRAFLHIDIVTELASTTRRAMPGQCFSGHEQFDVLWQGRKIAGAAQRRTRKGLLIQGSVQPPPLGLQRNLWEQAMIKSDVSGKTWEQYLPDGTTLAAAEQLAGEKYRQASYNRKK